MTARQPTAEELFHACLALSDAAARQTYLAERTAADPALRARVEQLLAAAAAQPAGFLQARGGRGGAAPASESHGIGEAAGDVVDRYKLLQPIGEGGMGTVWMAEQREPVVRKVALKIVKLGMDTREVVVRFEAERQALALMDHPHIAKVLDGGATAAGRPYFVMELVHGVPITDYCDQAKLGLRGRLELFAKVCEAIQHAHHKGVIHRDIKPSNVLVTLHDGVPVPKVIDFGIAKATSAELTKKTLFTQYAQILGTPEYMAPEQAEMSGLDIDTRADVYSLGVLLYELLTGTKPFDVKTALRVGFQELLRTIREDEPPRPSTRVSTLGEAASPIAARRDLNVRAWTERLRGELDWIVMKALEKDRTRRYDTPSGFALDIGRFLRDEAVVAAPPSPWYQFRKLLRRHRKTAAAVAVVAAVLCLGLVGTSWGLHRALEERDRADVAARAEAAAKRAAEGHAAAARVAAARAETEAGNARAAEATAQQRAAELAQVASFQALQLSGIDVPAMAIELRRQLLAAVPAEQREELAQRLAAVNFVDLALRPLEVEVFGRSLVAIDEHFADQPALQVGLLATVGQTMGALGLLAAAQPPLERAVALATREFGAEDPRTLQALGSLGNLRADRGALDEATRIRRQLFEVLQRTLGADHADTLAARHSLGAGLRELGRYDEAARELEAALAGWSATVGPDDRATLMTRQSLAVLQDVRGDLRGSEASFRELLAHARRVLPSDDVLLYSVASAWIATLGQLDRDAEGEAPQRELLAGLRARLGEEHPNTLHAKHTLSTLLERIGKVGEARQLLLATREACLRVLGPGHSQTLRTELGLGMLGLNHGDLALAERWLPSAAAGLSAVLGPLHHETLNARNALGGLLQQQGRVEEALVELRAVYEGLRAVRGDDHPEVLQVHGNVGAALWAAGRFAEAVPVLQEVHRGLRSKLGPEHRMTLQFEGNLAVNLLATGQAAAALPHFRHVYAFRDRDPSLPTFTNGLLDALVAEGLTAEVRELAAATIAAARAECAAGSRELAQQLANVGAALSAVADWEGSLTLHREVLAIREALQPNAWNTHNTRAMLGRALRGLGRFAEAEPLALQGAEGLIALAGQVPASALPRIAAALAGVVELYEAWETAEPNVGHAAKAQPWRERAAAFGRSTAPGVDRR